MSQNRIKLEREKLYEEVWAEPITVIAARYNLSDVGMAKACRRMSIPLPGRGYWARVRAGQSMKKIPLPPLPRKEQIKVDEVLTDPHPLIKAAQKRLSMKTGWDDATGIRRAPAEVLNIAVTIDSLDRALRLMDALVKHLTNRGVAISIDSKKAETVLDFDGISMPLSLSEQIKRTDHIETPEEIKARERHSKRPNWEALVLFNSRPRYDFHPTGMLIISVGTWTTRTCRDTNNTGLEERLGEVVRNVFDVAKAMKDWKIEMARKDEERRLAAEKYERAAKRLEDEKKALEILEHEAKDFQRSRLIQAYVQAVEADALASGSMTAELENWIAWAKLKADWLNPVNQISDLILDAPPPKRPGYW